jgi:hypothetical protein
MAAESFSSLPMMNRLLTIAKIDAEKKGHVVLEFHRFVLKGDPFYAAECSVCHATLRVVCTALKYERTGTAYASGCKLG